MMTIGEFESLLKEAHWTRRYRSRRKSGLQYAYAQKRINGKLREVYIAPVSDLGQVTREEVLEALTRAAAKEAK